MSISLHARMMPYIIILFIIISYLLSHSEEYSTGSREKRDGSKNVNTEISKILRGKREHSMNKLVVTHSGKRIAHTNGMSCWLLAATTLAS